MQSFSTEGPEHMDAIKNFLGRRDELIHRQLDEPLDASAKLARCRDEPAAVAVDELLGHRRRYENEREKLLLRTRLRTIHQRLLSCLVYTDPCRLHQPCRPSSRRRQRTKLVVSKNTAGDRPSHVFFECVAHKGLLVLEAEHGNLVGLGEIRRQGEDPVQVFPAPHSEKLTTAVAK